MSGEGSRLTGREPFVLICALGCLAVTLDLDKQITDGLTLFLCAYPNKV